MLKMFFFMVFLFLCFSCTQKKDDPIINEVIEDRNVINNDLENAFVFIIDDWKLDEKKICYILDFVIKRDSVFLEISIDLSPPYFTTYNYYLGYAEYKDDFIVCINRVPQSIVNQFIDLDKLNKDIGMFETFYYQNNDRRLDGMTYTFYINRMDELVFLRKRNY